LAHEQVSWEHEGEAEGRAPENADASRIDNTPAIGSALSA
jgi:hypothetical protein